MQFTSSIFYALLVSAVAAAPTSNAAPASKQGFSPARAMKARENIDPKHPHLTEEQQCTYSEVVGRADFNVVINNAKDFTDDECGSGFLDNLHGQGCTISGWGCQYAEDGTTMNANFATDLLHCTGEKVGHAIYAAFGGLSGVTCITDDPAWNLPPSRQ